MLNDVQRNYVDKTKKCFERSFPYVITTKVTAIVITLSIIISVFKIGCAYCLSKLSHDTTFQQIRKSLLIFILYIVFVYVYKIYINSTVRKNSEQIIQDLNNHWFKMGIISQIKSSHHFVSTLNLGLHTVSNVAHLALEGLLEHMIIFIIFLSILMYMGYAWFYLIWLFIHIFALQLVFNKLNDVFSKYQILNSKLNEELYDNILNIWSIKFEGIEDEIKSRFFKIFEEKEKLQEQLNTKALHYSKILPFCLFSIIICLIIYQFASSKDNSKRIFILLVFFQLYEAYFHVWDILLLLYKESYNLGSLCHIWEQEIPKPYQEIDLHANERITRIDIKDLCYEYSSPTSQVKVFENANFSIASGETVAIIGSSGSGKSTFVHLLFRLIKPNSGTIAFNGIETHNLSIHMLRRRMGIIPQRIEVFIQKTVLHNIILFNAYNEQKLQAILKTIHLEKIDLSKNCNNLSLGQKQRVIIARTLYMIEDVDIIVFDEYLSAINATWANEIHQYMINLIKQENKIGIFISHDPNEANMCDRIIKIQDSQLRFNK